MTVFPTPNSDFKILGVPDYYSVYLRWIEHYKKTNISSSKSLAHHYARVAEEMGQVIIEDEDDETIEIDRTQDV
jgi:hypothetical protein